MTGSGGRPFESKEVVNELTATASVNVKNNGSEGADKEVGQIRIGGRS